MRRRIAFMVLTRRFRPVVLLASVAFALAPAFAARTDNDFAANREFSSGFELFYHGPQWFLNALSSPATKSGPTRFVYDSNGARVPMEGSYIGTLANVYNPDMPAFSSPFFRTGEAASAFVQLVP